MENIKTREQLIEESKKPRWFLFSYDAGEEFYEWTEDAKKQKIGKQKRKFQDNDFRKTIIKILIKKKVVFMDEKVETTILFRDPGTETTLIQKLNYWRDEFSKIGADFYFVITPVFHYAVKGKEYPYFRAKPKEKLQANFKKLVREVREELKPK